ncbi:hypothetical protein Ga0466249_004834 [Sporomusaceae bacterium BoRhaA]|uniref:tail completion protein gp17 n=1 Tax=Pelorhabdus rhamnosifermentans TaxID=2772457 RepID=UPI001C0625CC|nr:hypothetical protein [Pelorhabdus rhamnosifermentans]MBU2703686.1 hypothetical protein [Pelorhabdus rhamnosifermentans]
MKQAKINIVAGLKTSTTLAAFVGTRISDAWPSATAVYPCVSYLQTTGTGEIADGHTIGFDEIYQISLFAKPEPGKSAAMTLESMAEAVLDVADDLGMALVGNSDLILDDGSGVKHKPLQFRYITRR